MFVSISLYYLTIAAGAGDSVDAPVEETEDTVIYCSHCFNSYVKFVDRLMTEESQRVLIQLRSHHLMRNSQARALRNSALRDK